MAVLSDVTSDPLTRFKNGSASQHSARLGGDQSEMVQEWVEWRVANPMDLAGYQAQMAIGLGLTAEDAAFENKLPSISVPTLILFGEHDKVVPPDKCRFVGGSRFAGVRS